MLGDKNMAKTWKRPEIKIPKTKSEWVWDLASTANSCWNFHTDCHWVDSTK